MRAPDLNAPRFRYKFTDILTVDMVKAFKKKYPQYANYKDMDLLRALSLQHQLMAREVRDSRDGIELPSNLGFLFIGMVKPAGKKKRQNIAWAKSIKLGIKVLHKNWETDNRIGKIFYCSYVGQNRFENRQLWAFNACRPFKRSTSEAILKNWSNYSAIDPHHYIWKLFEKNKLKDKYDKRTSRQLEEYNEFELED